MNSATLRLLKEKGLSLDDILEIADAMERKADPTNAERQARYRANRKEKKERVTRYSNGVTPPIDNTHTPSDIPSDEGNHSAARPKQLSGKPEGVRDQTWIDFTAMRKAQKAPVTPTVIDRISQEAATAGWTLDAALSEAVSRGWRGFKAIWVKDQVPVAPANDVSPLLKGIRALKAQASQQEVHGA